MNTLIEFLKTSVSWEQNDSEELTDLLGLYLEQEDSSGELLDFLQGFSES